MPLTTLRFLNKHAKPILYTTMYGSDEVEGVIILTILTMTNFKLILVLVTKLNAKLSCIQKHSVGNIFQVWLMEHKLTKWHVICILTLSPLAVNFEDR